MQTVDTCTVVSIVPTALRETKPGLIPSLFEIPAAAPGDFEILVVGAAKFGVYLDGTRGSIMVPTPAEVLAQSIVFDYIQAQIYRKPDAHPGLFWVPGTHDKPSITANFQNKLDEAKQHQLNWFVGMVQMGDDAWTENKKYAAVSESMRHAARALGLDRDWLAPIPVSKQELAECPYCGSDIKQNIVICPHCSSVLDEARYAKIKKAG